VGGPSDTAWDGLWVRCDPNGIWDGPVPVQPEDDHTPDPGTHCYVTGNGLPGSSDYQNDVDRGWTTLTSPLFDGAWYYQPLLKMSFWYSNDTGFFVDDTLRIELTNDAGRTWVSLLVTHTSTHAWANLPIFIESVIELSDSMQVRIVASDANSISSVEVAVDDFEISGAPFSGAEDQPPSWEVTFLGPRPNPFTAGSSLTFRLREPAPVKLEIFDAQGRCVRTLLRGAVASGSHEILWDATDNAGRRCDAGAYFSRFTGPGGVATRPLILLR